MDEPPLTLAEGGVIRSGYQRRAGHAARRGAQGAAVGRRPGAQGARAQRHLHAQGRLQQGLRLLHRGHATRSWPRAQPTTSASRRSSTGERYITPELKEYEALILNAQEKSVELEQELFARAAGGGGRAAGLSGRCGRRARWPSSTCCWRWPRWRRATTTAARELDEGDTHPHRRRAASRRRGELQRARRRSCPTTPRSPPATRRSCS